MIRLIYSLILYLLLPAVLVRLFIRGAKSPEYRRRWSERLALVTPKLDRPAIWIHAVSVGEVNAATPLIHELQHAYPGFQLLITTTTPTGSKQVENIFQNQVSHCYLPYDLNGPVKSFLRRVKPKLLIVMERELWPNLFHHAKRQNIPILIANARLPEKSARQYSRLKSLIGPTLASTSSIGAQTLEDANRFIALGAKNNSIQITGNTKYDIQPPKNYESQAQNIAQKGNFDRPLWIAASTHDGEEKLILDAQAQLLQKIPDALLILVPRHPERFDEVYRECLSAKLETVRRSLNQFPSPNTEVFLGDSMGELYAFYELASVAFVGGSLVPVGGHNVLEPALLGKAILFGHHMDNFSEISGNMLSQQAALQVADAAKLSETVEGLLTDQSRRKALGDNARNVVLENRGAVTKTMNLVHLLLPN